MKPLTYPFTFKQWLKHKSTKPKLKWIKELAKEINKKQLELNFE
jgi:hypothetical protein